MTVEGITYTSLPSPITGRQWRVSAGPAVLTLSDEAGRTRSAVGSAQFRMQSLPASPGLAAWHLRLMHLSGAALQPLLLRHKAAKLITQGEGAPFVQLKVEGESADFEVTLELRARRSPERGQHVVMFEALTRVKNRGSTALENLAWEDRLLWPGPPLWVPNLGVVTEAKSARVSWFGRQGQWSHLIGFVDAPRRVQFGFDPHGPWEQVARGDAFALAPGEAREDRRLLMVGAEALAPLASAFWGQTGPLVPVQGRIAPAPSRAQVQLSTAQGAPLLTIPVAADGSFGVDVPPALYLLTLDSTAGAHSQLLQVAAGRSTNVTIAMPSAGFLKVTVKDEAGEEIPARLRFEGIAGTPTPTLGLGESQASAGNFIYAAKPVDIELPEGQYRLTITRGPEFSAHVSTVHVRSDRGTSLTAQLDRVIDVSSWVGADLHVHALGSFDSTVSVADRLLTLAGEGVMLAVATDHNVVNDYVQTASDSPAWRWLAAERGIEVTTWDPYWGHFNAYPLPSNFSPPAPVRQTPTQIFEWVRQQAPDAILQVNHPRMKPLIGYFDLASFDPQLSRAGRDFSPDFDALELANGMDLGRQAAIQQNVDDWFALLNRGACYVATGSSDSHKVAYQWAGYPRTYVDVPRATALPEKAAFFAALRRGRAFVTSGPFLRVRLGDAELGDLVAASGDVVVRAEVQATALAPVNSIELVANGKVVLRRKLNLSQGGKITTFLPTHVARDTWLVVRLAGRATPQWSGQLLPRTENASFAFTNPIFIDADQDGVFTAPELPEDPALFPRCDRPHWPRFVAPQAQDAAPADEVGN